MLNKPPVSEPGRRKPYDWRWGTSAVETVNIISATSFHPPQHSQLEGLRRKLSIFASTWFVFWRIFKIILYLSPTPQVKCGLERRSFTPNGSFHSRIEPFCRRAFQVSPWERIHLPSRRCRSGRSPGEGNDNPLQCSCLGNLMDREAWQTPVHGVTNSQTWLSDWAHPKPLKRECCPLPNLNLREEMVWL